MSETSRSWWSTAILIGAVVAVALLLFGPLGTRFGVWEYGLGITATLAAAALAAIGLLLGVIAFFVTLARKLPADRPPVAIAVCLCALVLGVMLQQINTAQSVPQIHNISTDIEDPPRFDVVTGLRGPDANPLAYDSAKIGPLQREAYPEVRTLESDVAAGEMFNRAQAALEDMGLEIVNANATAGIIEATATTFWFGFKDDVVVRVRGTDGGSEVDVRSVSRVGLSDLGANARRIRQILGRLASA